MLFGMCVYNSHSDPAIAAHDSLKHYSMCVHGSLLAFWKGVWSIPYSPHPISLKIVFFNSFYLIVDNIFSIVFYSFFAWNSWQLTAKWVEIYLSKTNLQFISLPFCFQSLFNLFHCFWLIFRLTFSCTMGLHID